MSSLLARIMLAIFMLPLAAIVYLITLVVYWERWARYSSDAYLWAGATSWAFVATYWFALWRRAIRWTRTRCLWTAASVAGACIAAYALGIACSTIGRDFGDLMASMSAPLLWLVVTSFVWRETIAERAARLSGSDALVCPTCGYNLTGLTEPRCPECGSRFTLDELLRAQPGRAGAEIERAA
jgi:hypothetical protein